MEKHEHHDDWGGYQVQENEEQLPIFSQKSNQRYDHISYVPLVTGIRNHTISEKN